MGMYTFTVHVVITTKGLQDRNINILAGTTVENKGKLILNTNTTRLYTFGPSENK